MGEGNVSSVPITNPDGIVLEIFVELLNIC